MFTKQYFHQRFHTCDGRNDFRLRRLYMNRYSQFCCALSCSELCALLSALCPLCFRCPLYPPPSSKVPAVPLSAPASSLLSLLCALLATLCSLSARSLLALCSLSTRSLLALYSLSTRSLLALCDLLAARYSLLATLSSLLFTRYSAC